MKASQFLHWGTRQRQGTVPVSQWRGIFGGHLSVREYPCSEQRLYLLVEEVGVKYLALPGGSLGFTGLETCASCNGPR